MNLLNVYSILKMKAKLGLYLVSIFIGCYRTTKHTCRRSYPFSKLTGSFYVMTRMEKLFAALCQIYIKSYLH